MPILPEKFQQALQKMAPTVAGLEHNGSNNHVVHICCFETLTQGPVIFGVRDHKELTEEKLTDIHMAMLTDLVFVFSPEGLKVFPDMADANIDCENCKTRMKRRTKSNLNTEVMLPSMETAIIQLPTIEMAFCPTCGLSTFDAASMKEIMARVAATSGPNTTSIFSIVQGVGEDKSIFAVNRWVQGPNIQILHPKEITVHKSIEEAKQRIPNGATLLPKSPVDPENLIESWIIANAATTTKALYN